MEESKSKLYDDALKTLVKNRDKRLSGDIIAIPWNNLPRLSKVLPGVEPERLVIVTAG